jgi:hypothetical protein
MPLQISPWLTLLLTKYSLEGRYGEDDQEKMWGLSSFLHVLFSLFLYFEDYLYIVLHATRKRLIDDEMSPPRLKNTQSLTKKVVKELQVFELRYLEMMIKNMIF